MVYWVKTYQAMIEPVKRWFEKACWYYGEIRYIVKLYDRMWWGDKWEH